MSPEQVRLEAMETFDLLVDAPYFGKLTEDERQSAIANIEYDLSKYGNT